MRGKRIARLPVRSGGKQWGQPW